MKTLVSWMVQREETRIILIYAMLKNKIQITLMENGGQRAVGAGVVLTKKINRGNDRNKCYGQHFLYITKLFT